MRIVDPHAQLIGMTIGYQAQDDVVPEQRLVRAEHSGKSSFASNSMRGRAELSATGRHGE